MKKFRPTFSAALGLKKLAVVRTDWIFSVCAETTFAKINGKQARQYSRHRVILSPIEVVGRISRPVVLFLFFKTPATLQDLCQQSPASAAVFDK
jgi:hypothetical protein